MGSDPEIQCSMYLKFKYVFEICVVAFLPHYFTVFLYCFTLLI